MLWKCKKNLPSYSNYTGDKESVDLTPAHIHFLNLFVILWFLPIEYGVWWPFPWSVSIYVVSKCVSHTHSHLLLKTYACCSYITTNAPAERIKSQRVKIWVLNDGIFQHGGGMCLHHLAKATCFCEVSIQPEPRCDPPLVLAIWSIIDAVPRCLCFSQTAWDLKGLALSMGHLWQLKSRPIPNCGLTEIASIMLTVGFPTGHRANVFCACDVPSQR